jgi:hypothetical protein
MNAHERRIESRRTTRLELQRGSNNRVIKIRSSKELIDIFGQERGISDIDRAAVKDFVNNHGREDLFVKRVYDEPFDGGQS